MIQVNNYPKAYAEVEEILKYLDKKELTKISKDFINMISEKKDKNYVYKLDFNKPIAEQKVLRETKTILAYLYINYLCTEDEKAIIKQKFEQDIINSERIKEEKFSKDIFSSRKQLDHK